MLRSTPTPPPIHGTTNVAARGGAGLLERLHAWGPRLRRPRRRRPYVVGSRLLAIGLAVCVASGSVYSPAAAQQVLTPTAAPTSAPSVTPILTLVPTAGVSTNPLFRPVPTLTPTPVPTSTPTPGALPSDVVQRTDLVQPTPAVVTTTTNISGGQIEIAPLDPNLGSQLTLVGQEDPVTFCNRADYIYQDCSIIPLEQLKANLATATQPLRREEVQAIASVLQEYQLPESERPRVLRYARDQVRAALYAQVVEAFRKEAGSRDDDEKLLVAAFTQNVRDVHRQSLLAAQREYERWRVNPCAYQPPSGFTYDVRSACIGMSAAFTPESPGLRAFVAYGAKQTFENEGVNDPRTGALFWATSNAAVLGYSAGVTGLAAVGGAYAPVPAVVVQAIFPFAVRSVATAGGIVGGTAGGSTASAAAATGAGIAGILAATISALVTASISLANEVAIPAELQRLIDAAGVYNVEWIIQNCTGAVLCASGSTADLETAVHQELFAVHQLATVPDYPGTEPAPAPQAGDPRLVVAGSPVNWLRYQADDGSPRAVLLSSGPWFADRADGAGEGDARLTLSISFRNRDGTWTARRVGTQFLVARTDIPPTRYDYPAPTQSAALSVVDPDNLDVTAVVGQ